MSIPRNATNQYSSNIDTCSQTMRSILRDSLSSTLLTIVTLRLPRKCNFKQFNGLTHIFEIRLSKHFTSTSLIPGLHSHFIIYNRLSVPSKPYDSLIRIVDLRIAVRVASLSRCHMQRWLNGWNRLMVPHARFVLGIFCGFGLGRVRPFSAVHGYLSHHD